MTVYTPKWPLPPLTDDNVLNIKILRGMRDDIEKRLNAGKSESEITDRLTIGVIDESIADLEKIAVADMEKNDDA